MSPSLAYLAVCSVVLFFKTFVISGFQAYHRISKSAFANPEDARTFGTKPPLAEDLPEVQRAQRAWRNDTENLPMFFALGLLYVMVGANPDAAPWYFVTFTVGRILHTVAYLAGLQPWRTIGYTLGVLCLIGMAVQILLAV